MGAARWLLHRPARVAFAGTASLLALAIGVGPERGAGRPAGAAPAGDAGGGAGRLDARLRAGEVDATALLRRLAPGWLGTADRLRLRGLRVAATGVDPRGVGGGVGTVEVEAATLSRAGGELAVGPTVLRVTLEEDRVRLALEARAVSGTLAAFRGNIPRLIAALVLPWGDRGHPSALHGELTASDDAGREILVARLRGADSGRWSVSVRAPALERLDGLWPEIDRQVKGLASLDVEVEGPGVETGAGRLRLEVPEAVLAGGQVRLRDLVVDLPFRRGTSAVGEMPWGSIEMTELIAYGVVAFDVTSPARVLYDRLSVNDLAYELYAGRGRGWVEAELAPSGLHARGELAGEQVRIEQFVGAYGIRGGTMTGLLAYELDFEQREGRLGVKGRFDVPDGGTVNIELLDRLLAYTDADPSGVLRSAIGSLRAFEYRQAAGDVRSAGDDIRVSLALRGRRRYGIFPARVQEINIRNMPLSFLARQFPGR